jgi:hypothetical protein
MQFSMRAGGKQVLKHVVPFILFQASIILLASSNVPQSSDSRRPWVIGALVTLEMLAIVNLVVGLGRARQPERSDRPEG